MKVYTRALTDEQEQFIRERITWLRQKLSAQRDPSNADHTPNPLLVGRTEGNIGALEWCLRELSRKEEK